MLKQIKNWYWNDHIRHWIGILTLLAISVFAVNMHYEAGVLLSSLLNTPEHAPFDGTTAPIKVVPDWSHLSSGEYQYTYDQFSSDDFVDIPKYRNDYITYPTDKLVWGNDSDDLIRNTKITYPVPYAGNYELDYCGEGCGSHPAIDIKAPEGTPVYAIANGVVVKAGTVNGFGYSVVLKHEKVPSPNGGDSTTTVYSSYSHLASFSVAEGDVVEKGDLIAKVGHTGTATTAHLHFQLDTDTAPWHPYWPFTTAEATAAGYGFWDAVSAGVGQDNVYKYTYNPLKWVYANLNYEGGDTTDTTDDTEQVDTTDDVDTTDEDASTDTTSDTADSTEKVDSSIVTVDFDDIDIDVPSTMMIDQTRTISITLLDASGNKVTDPSFDGKISASVSDENIAQLSKTRFENVDFENGEAELDINTESTKGEFTITFDIAGSKFTSDKVVVIDQIQPFGYLGLITDGNFVPGKDETVRIQAMSLGGEPTTKFSGSGNVAVRVVEGSANLSKSILTSDDFKNGSVEITFNADSEDDVVIQVTYKEKTVESDRISSRIFTDFANTDNYYDAVAYLYSKGTVQGYPDGSFKPDRTVSRVEALKFIFSGMDQDVLDGYVVDFSDTDAGQWYSGYLATAYSLGIVQGYSDGTFKPSQGVNRVEFLKMLFSTLDVSIDPVVLEDPYDDVNNLSWYAPYVQYAKEKNIFPVTGSNFDPSAEMSRLEVAEVIYRLIVVSQNDGEPYSVLLNVR